MFCNMDDLKNAIYDLKDEVDASNCVLNEKIDNLESKISEIYDFVKNLICIIDSQK